MMTTPARLLAAPGTKLIASIGLLLALASVGASIVQPGNAVAIANADTCETSHVGLNGSEMAMIDGINAERVAVGLPPYLISAKISKVAAWMAEDVVTTGNFAHMDSSGRMPGARGSECIGLSLGENLAAGFFGGPAGVVAAWLGSPGHRANILNPMSVTVGVGIYGNVYVANFGSSTLDGVAWTSGGNVLPPSPPPPPPPASPPPPPAVAPPQLPTPATDSGAVTVSRTLDAGVNLVTYAGATTPVTVAMTSTLGQLAAVYRWDASSGQWQRYFPQGPSYINSLQWMQPGEAYFIVMNAATTWQY